jgi:CheY-like chemotaxis protein/DNA-binding MarR family transcriptional regulator
MGRRRIVVIDDDPVVLDQLARMIRETGATVYTGTSGLDALDLIRKQPPVEVLVSDIAMSGLSGLTLARTAREELGGRAPQLILTCNEPSTDLMACAIRAGAVGFLVKPVQRGELHGAVARALMRAASVDEAVTCDASNDAVPTAALDSLHAPDTSGPDGVLKMFRWMAEEQRVRAKYFEPGICTGAAWSILVELMHTTLQGKVECVSSTAVGSGVPISTALRHIETLAQMGLVERIQDSNDRRRIVIRLTGKGAGLMEKYIADVTSDSSLEFAAGIN